MSRVKIDYDLCEATGCCASVCPEDVLEHENGRTTVTKGEACTDCWICVDNCVSGAITVD
jgi:NAD-dependent dihydropyrimidine dehydrogenase PreA subunit